MEVPDGSGEGVGGAAHHALGGGGAEARGGEHPEVLLL